MRRSPERRLGAGEKDAEEVKKHLFFRVRGKEKVITVVIKEKNAVVTHSLFLSLLIDHRLDRAFGQEGEAAVRPDHPGLQ